MTGQHIQRDATVDDILGLTHQLQTLVGEAGIELGDEPGAPLT